MAEHLARNRNKTKSAAHLAKVVWAPLTVASEARIGRISVSISASASVSEPNRGPMSSDCINQSCTNMCQVINVFMVFWHGACASGQIINFNKTLDGLD